MNVVRQARAKYPRFWFQCRDRWLVCKAFEQLPGFAVILKWLLGKESDWQDWNNQECEMWEPSQGCFSICSKYFVGHWVLNLLSGHKLKWCRRPVDGILSFTSTAQWIANYRSAKEQSFFPALCALQLWVGNVIKLKKAGFVPFLLCLISQRHHRLISNPLCNSYPAPFGRASLWFWVLV